MNICFEKVGIEHFNVIYSWLAEPYIQEYWDNTQAHKDDIVNFMQGRNTPSEYAGGKYVYWIAKMEDEPFAMLMIIQETKEDNIGREKLDNLSSTGNTYGLDYMIGNKKYFGKGYGARTLNEFIAFFCLHIDPKADTFMIDPVCLNERAKHVFMKAGFKHVADFIMEGDCSGTGQLHNLLIKRIIV